MGLTQKLPMGLSPGLDHPAIGIHQGNHRNKLGLALSVRHLLCVFQQEQQPAPVVQGGVVPVPGRMHPGGASQCVHRNAGVVRQSRQAGGLHDGVGLEEGILLKGLPRLLHLHIHTQVGFQHQLYIQRLQNRADFHQLMRILAGQHYFHTNSPKTFFSNAISSRQPLPQSRRSFCSSSRVKGRPSPVPCTSIRLPLPFITQLRSTAARLSST